MLYIKNNKIVIRLAIWALKKYLHFFNSYHFV